MGEKKLSNYCNITVLKDFKKKDCGVNIVMYIKDYIVIL